MSKHPFVQSSINKLCVRCSMSMKHEDHVADHAFDRQIRNGARVCATCALPFEAHTDHFFVDDHPKSGVCEICWKTEDNHPKREPHKPAVDTEIVRLKYEIELLRSQLRTLSRDNNAVDVRYRDKIEGIAKRDVEQLLKKDKEYGASWKRRGGVGAFMTMIRKIDRLQAIIPGQKGYDIFAHLLDETGTDGSLPTESLLDTIRDLRGYLILIEADHLARTEKPDIKNVEDLGELITKNIATKCSGIYDNGATDGSIVGCSVNAGCGLQGCPSRSSPPQLRCRVCHNMVHLIHGKIVMHSMSKDDTRTCSSSGTSIDWSELNSTPRYGEKCNGLYDDGIADGNPTRCSVKSGCGLIGCPSANRKTDDF